MKAVSIQGNALTPSDRGAEILCRSPRVHAVFWASMQHDSLFFSGGGREGRNLRASIPKWGCHFKIRLQVISWVFNSTTWIRFSDYDCFYGTSTLAKGVHSTLMLKSTLIFGVGLGRCSSLSLLDRSLLLRGAGMKAMAAGYLALPEQRHSFPSNRMGLREATVSSKLAVTLAGKTILRINSYPALIHVNRYQMNGSLPVESGNWSGWRGQLSKTNSVHPMRPQELLSSVWQNDLLVECRMMMNDVECIYLIVIVRSRADAAPTWWPEQPMYSFPEEVDVSDWAFTWKLNTLRLLPRILMHAG